MPSARLAIFAFATTLLAPAALAQGTAAQRAACTHDAMSLCHDALSSLGRTRACMSSRIGDLSPRCHAFFANAAHRRLVRRYARAGHSINYGWAPRMPRWDPYEVQAEVHTFYPYRTPYLYPGLFY